MTDLINITKMRLLDKHYTNEVIMIQDEINKLIVFEGLQYFRGIFCEDEAFSVEIFNLRLNRHILLIENLLCNLEYAINRFNLLYNKYCSANNNNNNTFAYDLAIKAFLNNYYNISNKIYYIIQNNIERSELNIKNYLLMNIKSVSALSSAGHNNNAPVHNINNNNKNNNNKVNMKRSGYTGALSTIFGTTQQHQLQNKNYAAQQINKIVNKHNLLNNQKLHYNTLLFNYLKRMSIYNIRTNGLLIYNYHILKYNFNKNYSLLFHPFLKNCVDTIAIPRNNNNNINNKYVSYTPPIKGTGWANFASNEIHNFLKAFFKSINSLISKPTFVITPDKITISLFYYLSIPSPKVFNLYNGQTKATQSSTLQGSGSGSSSGSGSASRIRILSQKQKTINASLGAAQQPFGPETFTIEKSRALKILIRKHNDLKNKLNLFNNYNLTKLYPLRFKKICDYLSLFFNKPVEFELIRLHHSYHDAHILVTLLALIVKRKNIRRAIAKLYSLNAVKNLNDPNLLGGNRSDTATLSSKINSYSLKSQYNIPAFLSGLNIKIAGRLMREPIIPRRTTKIFEKGASATGKVNFLEVAKLTKKNRKGAFTITVLSGQNFF